MAVRILRVYGHLRELSVVMLVCGLVIGCSGSGGGDSASDNGGPVATDTKATGGNNPTGNNNSTGNNNNNHNTEPTDDGLAWVPFGPDDPGSPTPYWPAYNFFAEGKCGELRGYFGAEGRGIAETDLGKAMVAVCAAAIERHADQWAVVEAHAGADPSGIDDECLGGAINSLVARALAWHHQHPGRTPVVQIQRVEGRTECGKAYPPDFTEEPPSTSEEPPSTSEEPPSTSEEPPPTSEEPPPTSDTQTETPG
jgi:hypothetical protein